MPQQCVTKGWSYAGYTFDGFDTNLRMHLNKEKLIALFWPNQRDVIRWVAGTAFMCAFLIGVVLLFDGERVASWSDHDQFFSVTLVFASGCTMVLMMFVMGRQRLEIQGATIRSANLKSLYRWRVIDVHEVNGMEVSLGGYESMLAVLRLKLVPAPHRRWNQVEVLAVFGGSEHDAIDNRFFIPVAELVAAATPSIRIAYLPPNYKGALNHLRAASRSA